MYWNIKIAQPKRWRIIWYFLFSIYPLLAQDFIYKTYDADDGLPSSEVYDVLQDKQGYIWFSTDNGISRFDGYEFKNYNSRVGLGDQTVFHIKEDTKGRIWMSTLSNQMYILEDDSIRLFRYNNLAFQYQEEFIRLEDFYIDSTGTFYGYYFGLGVIKIQENGQHEVIRNDEKRGVTLYQIEDYLLTYTHTAKSLPSIPQTLSINLKKERATTKYYTSSIISEARSVSLGHALDDQLLIFGSHQHVFLFQDRKIDTFHIAPDHLSAAFYTKNGGIILGYALQNGAYFYPSLEDFRNNRGLHFLKGYYISDIIEDNAGGWWFTTLDDGVLYIPQPTAKVYHEKAGLSGKYVKALTKSGTNTLHVGLLNGLVYEIGPEGIPRLRFNSENRIFELFFDLENPFLWRCGMAKDERNMRNITTQRKQFYFTRTDSINITARKLKMNPDHSILYGCSSGFKGIFTIQQDQTTTQYLMSELPNSHGWTNDVQEDYQGNLWVGRTDGLYLYQDQHLQFIDLGYPYPQTRVEEIHLLADSTLVIGTKGQGIIFWKNDTFQQLQTEDGLLSSEIEVIHIADHGHIWVGTLKGLNKIVRKGHNSFKIESFTNYHGLASNEVNDVIELGEKIWVATTKGLSILPKDRPKDTMTFQPIIDKVLVNNEISSQVQLLPYKSNNISIHFRSLDYRQAGEIKYRYRLQQGQNWQLSSVNRINLLSLNSDQYQFEVQAQNRAGNWSPSSYLYFRIKAPFWQRWWFLLTMVLLVGSLIYLELSRRNRIRLQQAEINQEINQLRQLALQSQMNPHFVFNCLNAIQGFVANGDSINSTRYLAKFSDLVRKVLKVSNTPKINLEAELSMLENYLELEQMRFGGLLKYQFIISETIDLIDTYLPPLLLQPIIENSIIHGFSEIRGNYLITLQFQQINLGKINIIITDNGKGFPNKKLSQHPKSHQSLGLNIVRRRIKLLPTPNGPNTIETSNLLDTKQKIIGAKVELNIASL